MIFIKICNLLTFAIFAFISIARLLSICVWFLPDIVMLVSSIVAYVVLRKITIGNNSDDIEEAEAKPVIENDENEDDSFSPENYILIRRAGNNKILTKYLRKFRKLKYSFCSYNMFVDNAFNSGNIAAIRSKCRLFSCIFNIGHMLVMPQRIDPTICNCLPLIIGATNCTH